MRREARRHEGTKARRAGFTLVELVVVIGIIVVLAAITVAVSVNVVAASEARQTENVIRLLDLAVAEWAATADRQPSWGDDNAPFNGASYDIKRPDAPDVQLSTLLKLLRRNPDAKAILAQVDQQMLRADVNDPSLLLLQDPWGELIYMIHPGRIADLNAFGAGIDGNPDDDGTVRTAHEDLYGIAVNRQICFVSAGPDGRFGDLSMAVGTPDRSYAEDNLYSYEVVVP